MHNFLCESVGREPHCYFPPATCRRTSDPREFRFLPILSPSSQRTAFLPRQPAFCCGKILLRKVSQATAPIFQGLPRAPSATTLRRVDDSPKDDFGFASEMELVKSRVSERSGMTETSVNQGCVVPTENENARHQTPPMPRAGTWGDNRHTPCVPRPPPPHANANTPARGKPSKCERGKSFTCQGSQPRLAGRLLEAGAFVGWPL